MLARLKPKRGETQRAWLLFKERDSAAELIATSSSSGRRA
jgi:uncharacterized protein YecT (DUF1311 family)